MAKLLGPPSFSEEAQFALEVVREAGHEILMPQMPLGRQPDLEEMKGERDLVTPADKEVERFLYAEIKANFPDHAVYAEEEVQEETGSAPARWIVDPLDGTTNYVHGHPYYAISMALERGGVLDFGVVFVPYLDEIFYAERGRGAYLNSEKIRISVSGTERLIEAVLATGFAYDREAYPNDEAWARFTPLARGLRRCGAAAIDLAYVACGRYDGFWEPGLAPYDVAAGAVLVLEAGGQVTDYDGGDGWLFGRNLVASNGRLHDLIRAELRPA